jgi:hypothetical protein
MAPCKSGPVLKFKLKTRFMPRDPIISGTVLYFNLETFLSPMAPFQSGPVLNLLDLSIQRLRKHFHHFLLP